MSKSTMRETVTLLVALTALSVGQASGHHAPEHRIEELTESIAADGESTRLLLLRAEEYLSLGQVESAIGDYRAALTREPLLWSGAYGLCKALLLSGSANEAEAIAAETLGRVTDERGRAPLFAVHAGALEAQGKTEKAADAWLAAARAQPPEPDWVLRCARCLKSLNRHGEACAVLQRALDRQPNAAFRTALIELQIDTGRYKEAEEAIRVGLRRSRTRHRWLVLDAKLALELGDPSRSVASAREAVAELRGLRDSAPSNPFIAEQLSHAERVLSLATVQLDRPWSQD